MDFPSSIPNPEYPFKVDHEDNSIKTQFEDGTVQSRRKFTKSRKTWILKWESLKQNYYDTLENFIVNQVHHSAVVFNWLNPADNRTYAVRCIKFDSELRFINYWNVELQFQEA